MVVNKRDMQKEAPKKHQDKMLCREAERERARMLQRLGGSRATKHWSDAQDNM